MFFAASTIGFYDPEINVNIPFDAVEISTEQWQTLLNGQAAGKIIASDQNGYPVLIDPPAPTPLETVTAQENVVQKYLDNGAAERDYSGIISACSYSNSTNALFKSDADTCIAWRDACWEYYLIYAQSVQMGASVLTDAQLLAELPVLVWPSN